MLDADLQQIIDSSSDRDYANKHIVAETVHCLQRLRQIRNQIDSGSISETSARSKNTKPHPLLRVETVLRGQFMRLAKVANLKTLKIGAR